MRVVRISGPGDPRVKDYGDIGDHERLKGSGLFVAEGRLVVERLIDDARVSIHSLLLNGAAFRALEPRLQVLRADAVVFVCEPGDFETLTGHDFHRGCLALAARPAPLSLDDVSAGVRSLVALEDVANADNIGSIFRNAAAFGAGGVVLSPGCADPLYRKAIRTSMAATLRVPFAAVAPGGWGAALGSLRDRGFQIAALTLRDGARDLDEWARGARAERLVLLFGAEGAGLGADAESAADVCVRIPIRPDVDSLNVAVASGIAMHRLLRW